MRLLLLATAGGALGAGARYLVNVGVGRLLTSGAPLATMIVNVTGSFAMGIVVAIVAARYAGSPELRVFLATGILGGFTTFSAFSLDFYNLAQSGRLGLALTYAIGSVTGSLLAIYTGFIVGQGMR